MRPTKFTLLRRRLAMQAPTKSVPVEVALRLDLIELLAEGGAQRAREALRTAGADLDRGIITTYPDPSDPAKVLVVWKSQDADNSE
jgi:hypothetical protein